MSEMARITSRDALDSALAGLRAHDASPARVERIRARSMAAIASRRRRAHARSLRAARWQRRAEMAAALGLSALYLVAAVGSSLALLR